MPSQNGNGGRSGPWGSGAKSSSDLEDLGDLYVSFSKGPGKPGPSLFSRTDGGDQ
jgi:hypothetical protein